MRWVSLVLLAGCMVASPVMRFGGGKSAQEAQHDTLSDLLPARLAMERQWRGQVATATIRVYADEQYRAQNLEWRRTFESMLDYANAVLDPTLGVKLVADYREWKHHAPSAPLDDHLHELARLDPGKDVLCVVGMTSSLGLVSATFDQLGVAQLGGRHLMLRGYSDVEERRAFTLAFPALSSDERDNALAARRIHKMTAVLLHEIAHNLGAPHDQVADMLMSEHYSHRAAAFTTEARDRIQLTLDQRLGRAKTEPVSTDSSHGKLSVRVVKDGFIVDGRPYDDSEINIVFSTQAGMDAEVQVEIERAPDVSVETVKATVERAKRMGLKRFAFR
jgi:hypothetical protein